MSVSWYDVLGVSPDATEDEIRAAWRAATTDLEPTDRRFDLYNQAAKVLLDADSRAAYDGEVEVAEAPASVSAQPSSSADDEAEEPAVASAAPARSRTEKAEAEKTEADTPEARGGVPVWLIGALAVAVLVVAGVASYFTWFADEDGPADNGAAGEAQTVLDDNFGDILTYRWDDLEAAHQRASALLTPRYQCEFDRVWALVEKQAESVEPVVTTTVVRSGVSQVSDDGSRVELVALIRNEVVNKGGDQGIGSLLLGVTMVEKDGSWLVDEVDGLEGGDAADGSDPCAPAEPSDDAS